MREFFALCWRVSYRHLSIYRQDLFANMAPTLIDPIMFIVAFGLGLGSYVGSVENRNYMHYMAPGLAVTTALFTAFFETSYGFYVRMKYERIYDAVLTTPVGVDELIGGEFLWVGIKGAIMSTGVSFVMLAFGLVHPNYLFLIPFLGFCIAIACGSLGFIASSMVNNINQFQTVYALLISPLFFFSGVFYPIEKLPKIAQFFSSLSPLYHGVKIGQQVLWGGHIAHVLSFNAPILLCMCLVLAIFAYKKIRPIIYL
ncbi:MAG: ABC transporter permease [Bdellovibrionota bacterium]